MTNHVVLIFLNSFSSLLSFLSVSVISVLIWPFSLFTIFWLVFWYTQTEKNVERVSNSVLSYEMIQQNKYTNYIKYPVDDYFYENVSIVSFQERAEIA